MRAIVLAAGRGERMRPLTDHTPKPLLAAGGQPLIAYHLQALRRAGVQDVVINLSWLGDRIRAALGDGTAYGVRIAYSEEGPVPLETGGGIFHALPLLGAQPFVVVNGDNFWDYDLRQLRLDGDAQAQIVLVPNPAHNARGDFGLDGERVTADGAERYTYAGIGIYRPELFANCGPGRFPLLPLLREAISAGRLRGQLHRGVWMDIGSPERLAELEKRLAGGSTARR